MMPKTFKHSTVATTSPGIEAGSANAVIFKNVVSDIVFKGHVHHATRNVPQYLIRGDKPDHVAIGR